MSERIEIGKIVNTHSLKGEVKVTPWCDDEGVFDTLKFVYTTDAKLQITAARPHKNSVIVKFVGIDHIDEAQKLRDKILYAEKSDLKELPTNTYYIKDLLNMNVFDANDNNLGIVVDCFPTGSNDVYVVKNEEGKQILLPAIKQVIKKIDVENKRMTVELMEGLLGDED